MIRNVPGSWRISRRTLLKGFGAALALPLLNCMRIEAAESPASPASTVPRRMVCIYAPNGVNPWEWFTSAGDALSAPTLKPLAAHAAAVTAIYGLHHPAMRTNEGHNGANTWLTGADVSATPGIEFRNTVSADQILAETTAAHTRFGSLEVSLEPGGGGPGMRARTLAWTKAGIPLPSTGSLQQLFAKLFEPDSVKDLRDQQRLLGERKRMLDSISASAKQLNAQLGIDDQRKLSEYLEAVAELERRIERSKSWQGIPKPTPTYVNDIDKRDFLHGLPSQADDPIDYFPAMYQLLALALQSDSTRVITVMTGSEGRGITLRERGITTFHHGLSHHNHDASKLKDLAATDRFQIEEFAKFLSRLHAMREGDSTVLARTAILYGSGMSDAHNTRHLPILLAGGSALGLRHRGKLDLTTGGTPLTIDSGFDVKVNAQARLSNLLLTMLNATGVRSDRFADSTGPITQLMA